jgi:microcystin degradation protein MlrC
MFRVAIGGIAIESCTFNPLRTQVRDFNFFREGVDFGVRYPFLGTFPDLEFIPTVRARALPGASVDQAAYQQIKGEILERLRALLPLDGVYLDMHGAMHVDGLEDAEGDWYASVRQLVGGDCLIAASYDLHGNMSQRIIDNLDLLSAYRTAPHVDEIETRRRTVAMLVEALRTHTHPFMTWQRVPVLLPGEKTSTEWQPGQSLYAKIPGAIIDGIWDLSILIGYAWADEPRSGASVVGVGTKPDAIKQGIEQLAAAFWDVAADFDFGMPALPVDECIRQAMASTNSPVFISDSGDNPTAGGVGDVTVVLGRLLALGATNVIYASIWDADAVAACEEAGEGSNVMLTVGGKLDTINSQPLRITGVVRRIVGTDNKQVVIDTGSVNIILTEKRTPYHHISDFEALGLNPMAAHIVVVKIGYLEPELKAAARDSFLVLSPGAVNQDIVSLPFRHVQRPIFPLDRDFNWTPSRAE